MQRRGGAVNKLVLTWPNFEQWMESLAQILRFRHPQLHAVYGPPRGGSIPAVVLSHRLNLLHVQSIDHLNLIRATVPASGVLWVDEIVDSGRTLETHRRAFPGTIQAAWCVRAAQMSRFPDLIAHMVPPDDDWLVFPWEDRRNWEKEQQDYHARRSDEE